MRLKSTIYESTLSTADAVPLPRWGRLRGATLRVIFYKGAMPEGGKQSPATRNHSFLLSNYGVQRVQKVLRVQVAASPHFDDGILVSLAFPSRGRCPEGADRALAV